MGRSHRFSLPITGEPNYEPCVATEFSATTILRFAVLLPGRFAKYDAIRFRDFRDLQGKYKELLQFRALIRSPRGEDRNMHG
jgi:hypothetical protein